MWTSKHQFQNNNGFSLIELIVSISIISMVIVNIYSMLTFSINSSTRGELYDDILLNGRYGIEYIKDEIKRADKIISVNNISVIESNHPHNMGFVIMQEFINERGNTEYKYISYYLGDGSINRVAYNKENDASYPNKRDKAGYNFVCDYVLSIEDSYVDFEKNLINLDISVGSNKKIYHNYKSTIAIRCLIDN